MKNENDQPQQLNIEISEEISEGSYANLAIITHSHAEFVVDFVNVMPGAPKSKVEIPFNFGGPAAQAQRFFCEVGKFYQVERVNKVDRYIK